MQSTPKPTCHRLPSVLSLLLPLQNIFCFTFALCHFAACFCPISLILFWQLRSSHAQPPSAWCAPHNGLCPLLILTLHFAKSNPPGSLSPIHTLFWDDTQLAHLELILLEEREQGRCVSSCLSAWLLPFHTLSTVWPFSLTPHTILTHYPSLHPSSNHLQCKSNY